MTLALVGALAGCGSTKVANGTSTTTSTSRPVPTTTSLVPTTISSPTTASTGVPDGKRHICDLVTKDELSGIIGQKITETNAPTDLDGCSYFSAAGAQALKGSFGIDLLKNPGGKAEAATRDSSAQMVVGIGDLAYYEGPGFSPATLYVLKGDTLISMNGGVGLELSGMSKDLPLDTLAKIGKIAASRL
jgi:hypothetical protein